MTTTIAEPETEMTYYPLLKGQKGLIMGVANKWSIAWGIAQSLSKAGMELAFTYQGERLEKNVRELAQTLEQDNPPLILPCDITDDAQIDALFSDIGKEWGGLDTLVHCIAFANKDELVGQYMSTTREGYLMAQEVSSYSLTAVSKVAAPLMAKRGGGSIITLTYYGGEKVVQNYNVMGVAKAALEMSVRYLAEDLGPENIRVNAISAGPIKTLAASGVSGLSKITEVMKEKAPLRRNVDTREVGDTALYLASQLSRGVTGETIHVDSGYHIKGF